MLAWLPVVGAEENSGRALAPAHAATTPKSSAAVVTSAIATSDSRGGGGGTSGDDTSGLWRDAPFNSIVRVRRSGRHGSQDTVSAKVQISASPAPRAIVAYSPKYGSLDAVRCARDSPAISEQTCTTPVNS